MPAQLAQPAQLPELIERTEAIVRDVVAPNAAEEDRQVLWPEPAMRAFAAAGLLGLNAPVSCGGHGLGLEALVSISRVIARSNPSAALCYAMHCVGTTTIAVKATPDHNRRFLEPIAAGEHITTLALSEPGTGVDFYIPETTLDDAGDAYIVRGTKSFVTNGGRADSYVISAVAPGAGRGEGQFTAAVLEEGMPGMRWGDEWHGFGMRGNSSRSVQLDGVELPKRNILGKEGDQLWYVFEVIAPTFLAAMAGTYLGIAEAAVDIAAEHLGSRRHTHTGELLGSNPLAAAQLGSMWVQLEAARQLVLTAARRADSGDPAALPGILACKAAASDAAVDLTNQGMTMVGGSGYGENGHLARLLRDARASHVMAPTTNMLHGWLGRALMGMPLLQ